VNVNETAKRLHAELLQLQPDDARHDADLCPICAAESASARPDPEPRQEGGKHTLDAEKLTQETHQALVRAAVEQATAESTRKVNDLTAQVAALTTERDTAASQAVTLTAENDRLNGELDAAQIQLRTVSDEKSALEADLAARVKDAQLAEVAAARATQVRNLQLFPEDHIAEKARKWAEVDETDWADRLEEWKTIRGTEGASAPPVSTTPAPEQASALTGSTEAALTTPSLRRTVLGLPTARKEG